LIGFLFGTDGQVRRVFLSERNRRELIEAFGFPIPVPVPVGEVLMKRKDRLRNRFILMGVINAVFAPFIVLYLLMYSFFRYFEVRLSFSLGRKGEN